MRTRRFVVLAGWTWQALEISSPPYEDAHAILAGRKEKTVLYFISRYATRRMEDFPDDWPALSSAQLASLCERASPIVADWTSRGPELHDRAPHIR